MTRDICKPALALLLAFAIQNIEEILFLPSWMRRFIPPGLPVTASQFTLATLILTGLVAALVATACFRGGPITRLLLIATAAMLLANSVTQILVSAGRGSIMPGAASGLLLQGPAAIWVLRTLDIRRIAMLAWTVFGLVAAPIATLAVFVISTHLIN
ncbi:HXXEE domain-containing protein [Loktanella sp. IMCC34160]|uniref:HXXEE domain-containing protein n=1 Tax=Loktanella sp. IMCC34160 TaxID=2510646 RepID=UPI00101D657B|nr:HXXEE domain-containing protein [Loktanella sp. IMCC34160]RYG91851.1 HXXEE domain-containing protein [Loktanella sp. IMCC34160]